MVNGVEARKALRKAVRTAWDRDPALIQIQQELKKTGYELLHKKYRDCLESNKPIAECYREVANAPDVKLADQYRKIWGAPVSMG